MFFGRFSLQSKIILIIAATVILVVGVSTFTAMWLTREPVEERLPERLGPGTPHYSPIGGQGWVAES